MFHFAGQHKAFLWVSCKLILLNWFFQHLFTTNSASHSFLLICSLMLLRQTLFVLIVYVNFYFTFKRFHNVLQCRLYGHSAKATCFNKKKRKTRTSSLVLVSNEPLRKAAFPPCVAMIQQQTPWTHCRTIYRKQHSFFPTIPIRGSLWRHVCVFQQCICCTWIAIFAKGNKVAETTKSTGGGCRPFPSGRIISRRDFHQYISGKHTNYRMCAWKVALPVSRW